MNPPPASKFSSSPLRNRIRVELRAEASHVWALLGDLRRFPEYSSGLERVEAKVDSNGVCAEYVCHFKPQQEGGERISHRELIRWYEPNRGFASSAEEGNAFGLTNCLTLVTLDSSREHVMITWDQYYDAAELELNKTAFDQALADIGENLAGRFGGTVVERYVENEPQNG